MFHTFGVFETPFFKGFDIFYRTLVVLPTVWDDHIMFAWVRNLAGDDTFMAIGTDFQLNWM